MNKELTPLKALHSLVEIFATKKYDEKGNLIYWENILDTLSKNGEYRIIEKALKALEIIKDICEIRIAIDETKNDKYCGMVSLVCNKDIYVIYTTYDKENIQKLKLLKEVLLCGSQK